MGNYASITDVQGRVPSRTASSSSAPTTTQATLFITQTEAVLDGELTAIGISVPITTPARAVSICQDAVVARCAAMWLQAKDSSQDEPQNTELITSLMKQWDDFITLIREKPGTVAEMLGVSFGDTASSGALRSYQTDRAAVDGKSISAGDFDPVFKRDTDW